MRRWVLRIDGWLGALETAVCLLILALLLGLSLFQIIARSGFNQGILWIDPVLRTLVLWIALLGGALAAGQDKSIKIDIADRFLPTVFSGKVRFVLASVAAVLCVFLAVIAMQFVAEEKSFGENFYGVIKEWHRLLVLPLAAMLMSWHFLAVSVRQGWREES